MPKVKSSVCVSVDNCMAGHHMTEEHPFGDMPKDLLFQWRFDKSEQGQHEAEMKSFLDAGAYIMGRNMFGPTGEEYDRTWQGWWGDEPPYHAPVFVLTHLEREPLKLQGGTTFHFVTDGIEAALKQAREAAGDRDVSIAGGAATINQFLAADLIEELWLHITPVVYGDGKRLFEGLSTKKLQVLDSRFTPLVTHVRYGIVGS